MNLNRINPLIVAAVGIVLSLIAVAGIGFGLIKPALDNISTQQARYDANYPDSTPQAQLLAKKQLDAAKKQVQQIKFRWAVKDAALMPRFDVSDRAKALRQLTYELDHYLGPDLEHQLRKTPGAISTTVFSLPAPPVSPNDITAAPIVIPLGTVTVNGDFRHILKHFYVWQSFDRLVMVDNLAFNGNSPFMQGSYTATLYIFPQNDDKLPPVIAEAGTGTATGGAGGAGGYPGGAGGFPGGAGGFPGGAGGPPGGFPSGAGGPPPGYRGGPPPGGK